MILVFLLLALRDSGKPPEVKVTEEPSEIPASESTISSVPKEPAEEFKAAPPAQLPKRVSSSPTVGAAPAPKILPSQIVVSLPKLPKAATATPETVDIPAPLPPLDEDLLLRSVVKIQCPTADGIGKYIGSGFAIKSGVVVTAAHVVKDSGSQTCEVIFPKDRRPIHYLRGTLENLKEVARRHDEEGIDVAVLSLPPLESYPEGRAIFESYPSISYPFCENPKMLGDKLLHFGYPSNFVDQSYLSRLEGEVVIFADINGIREELSQDQTYTFKTPIFSYTYDESKLHPYMVSRVPSFYGDSGGLAFNVIKQCILGPHRGGTIGGGVGENYSVFPVLGWEKTKNLIP